MAAQSVDQIFEETMPERLRSRPELVAEIGSLIHFRITGDGGGEWTLDCTKEEPVIGRGLSGEPAMTVTCGDSDFVAISAGKLNPNMAAMSGKLRLSPMDLGLGMKLAKLLG